jgi:TRAP-type C4-dicarboxylate transport system permease small subunit
MNGPGNPRAAVPLERLGRMALSIAALSLAGLVFTQLWQVIGRYVFNATPSWTETISMLLMNAAMVFGAAAGVHAGAHFGFTLGIDRLPPSASRVLHCLVQLLIGVLGGAIALYGFQLAADTWPVKVAGAPLPQGLVYAPLLLGGLLMVLFAGARGWSIWRGRVRIEQGVAE